MKKHAIIPIFIPHEGCPNDCVFCNQKKITARQAPVHAEDVRRIIEEYLVTLDGRGIETIEVAFFGGSFTGIPKEEQSEYLAVAKEYKDKGVIHKIHLSTRPDYISGEILDNLKYYTVDVIELGVQSFDDEVLRTSNRGHSSDIVYTSCEMIKNYGFELGIQLMIGLPEDTKEKCIYSAMEAVKIGPSIARLYPTVIIDDTELLNMYNRGEYKALSQDEAVETTKEMYKILTVAGIKVIRVGLKSTDIINGNGAVTGDTYHPAFRQLVEGAIARDMLEEKLKKLLETEAELMEPTVKASCENFDILNGKTHLKVTFESSGTSFSNMVGNNKKNKLYFAEKYPCIRFKYAVNNELEEGNFEVRLVE